MTDDGRITSKEFLQPYRTMLKAQIAVTAAKLLEEGQQAGMVHLKTRIRASGLSYGVIAERTGCEPTSICNWANCRNYPSAFYLPALASALGCTIEDLYLPPEEGE